MFKNALLNLLCCFVSAGVFFNKCKILNANIVGSLFLLVDSNKKNTYEIPISAHANLVLTSLVFTVTKKLDN
jgi:hypothetical protein